MIFLQAIATIRMTTLPWFYVFQKRFPDYFKEFEATELTILLLCQHIWYKYCLTLDVHVQYYIINLLQLRKNRLKARATVKTRVENNQSNPSENLLGNKTLDNIIEDEDFLRDLSILSHKCLQTTIAETIYEWRNSDIQENLAITATLYM